MQAAMAMANQPGRTRLNAATALAQTSGDEGHRSAAMVTQRHEERLLAHQSGLDDLIGLPLKLCKTTPTWHQMAAGTGLCAGGRIPDTNATQYDLPAAGGHPGKTDARFTAVGDDDQSIYGWRGYRSMWRNCRWIFLHLKVSWSKLHRSTAVIL